MAVTQEMLTPKLMVGMLYFQKKRTDFVRVIFGYPKVLEPRKVCILFNYAGILFLTLCVFS